MFLFIPLYIILGIGYLFWSYNYEKLPEMWSPIQPVGFIFLWPIILILNIIRYIKNYITIKK